MSIQCGLKDLVSDGEVLAEYVISGSYIPYHCIIERGSTDIASALEDTLHRILDAGGSKEDIYEILGAKIPNEEERRELQEFDEFIVIDLGYVIPGLIMSFHEEDEEVKYYEEEKK